MVPFDRKRNRFLYEAMCESWCCVSTWMFSILVEVGARVGRVRSVATGFGLQEIVAVDGLDWALVAVFEIEVVGER